MANKFFKYFATIACLLSIVSACRKSNVEELGDAGKTFLKILESPSSSFFFEPFTGNKPVALFSLRRDANSNAQLNTPVIVTLRLDTAAVRAYNAANANTFELLPDSLFTLGAGITKTGNLSYQMSLQPGEFAKDFMINLNGSKWDLSRKYSMPFVIQDPGGLAVSASRERVISLISIKNKYDGRYTMTGTLTDNAVPALTAKSPTTVHLLTTGADKVIVFNAGTDVSSFKTLFPILNAGAESAYGSFMPVFTFDANNKVIKVENSFGQPASNTRSAAIDPTGENMWDPATKTLKVKWFMYQPSAIAGIRTSFDFTFTFLGPR